MDTQKYTANPRTEFRHLSSHHDNSLDRALHSQELQRVNEYPFTNENKFSVNPQSDGETLDETVLDIIDSPEIIDSNTSINLRNIVNLGGDYVAQRVRAPMFSKHPNVVRVDYINFEGGNIHTVHVVLPTEEFPGNGYFISPTGPGTPENPGEKLRSKYFKRESK